jgi:signal transduction histidine kinase
MHALPFQASSVAQWLWFQFRSILRHPLPKENGFTEWWAQRHGEFGSLGEAQAKTIYDAGQDTIVNAMQEIRQHVKTVQFIEDESRKESQRPMEDRELTRLRELHDAALQAMIATEIQLDILRSQAEAQSSPLAAELSRIRGILREEVLKIREIMRQPLDVDSSNLLQFLRDTVERFQRETGINASFVSELDEVDMQQNLCREVVRIVQERLIRVRRLSATQHVLVRLAATNSHWQLIIEDDGRFYEASAVIQERVRLIEGEFTVESKPGGGSRLVVTVKKDRHG